MNRLVIIGNGFDLAHGLPTGYCDFIDWYWSRVGERLNEKIPDMSPRHKNYIDELINIKFIFSERRYYEQEEELKNDLNYLFLNFSYINLNKFIKNRHGKFNDVCIKNYKNIFFKTICDKHHIQNWVDIENEYYQLLKECLQEKDNKKVKRLNEEFEQVKNLLEEYLVTEVEKKYNLYVDKKILNIITKTSYNYEEAKIFVRELNKRESAKLLSLLGLSINLVKFLNFNYTSLLKKSISYYAEDVYDCNHIHGELDNKDNLINFGFGDEMDDDYKTIEKKDDNEYLRNIKSFAYLNTPNYKNLIDFLELDKYQVYIMGHSCGLSDRILLNKVFEHQNCISIKIYYHQKDGWDNYTDIAQNVSRHFNKKEMMRERIVNKTYCEPLPQTKLPLKNS
ncbi:hypothetical protein KJK34_13790 [Flavobacterium sp. D11R37]|uniref:AbiH family protein n=1 Tax=Flavobacterium coralii TaxID=2838017 RepID=UPI001CA75401|nr:AbiH family protein [Flavobacterium coralii]MBY8963828.1 hypothetical protein [Flavobacterium coralii]